VRKFCLNLRRRRLSQVRTDDHGSDQQAACNLMYRVFIDEHHSIASSEETQAWKLSQISPTLFANRDVPVDQFGAGLRSPVREVDFTKA
jgi:hypothetical protein